MNMENMTLQQQKYIAEWHQDFTAYISRLKNVISALMLSPQVSEEDKRGFEMYKVILEGKDVKEIEKNLRDGNISKSVLNKIEKLDKALVDFAIEHLRTDVIVKEFLKQLAYLKIAHDKKVEENTLKALNIPIGGE